MTLPNWKIWSRFAETFTRKPPQPRCTCGRFCSSHEDVPDMKAKLISELSAQHKHVPVYFRKERA